MLPESLPQQDNKTPSCLLAPPLPDLQPPGGSPWGILQTLTPRRWPSFPRLTLNGTICQRTESSHSLETQSRGKTEGEPDSCAHVLGPSLSTRHLSRPCSPSATTSQHKARQDEVTDEALPRKPVVCACVCLAQALKMGSGWEERTEPVRESKDPSSNPSSVFHRSVGLGTRLGHLPISVLHRW